MFKEKNIIKKVVDIKLLKFAIVGVINTIVGMVIMFGMYNIFNCSYWVSSATNYTLTSILSYILNKKFTFKYKGNIVKSAVRFAVNIVVCYLLAYGIAKPLTLYFMSGYSVKIRENTAMFVGMMLFVGFNYLGQRFFAFNSIKTKKAQGEITNIDRDDKNE